MTNEALAVLIQQGDNDELLPVLWEKTAKLLYKMSAQTYILYKDALKQHGILPEDLNQECYTVLLGAVKAYDSNKGYMLSTYFGYQFKQVLRKLLNGADVLDRIDTKSFDDPMTDEEDAPTRGDITPDPESGAGFERVDMLVWRNTELFTYRTSDNLRQTSYYTPLHKALDSLAPADREIIELRFFSLPGAVMSYTDMGERLGISLECVRQRLNNALNKLRRGRMGIWLRKVYGDDYTAHTFGDNLATYRRYFSSGVELRALARIHYEERQQRARSLEPLTAEQDGGKGA